MIIQCLSNFVANKQNDYENGSRIKGKLHYEKWGALNAFSEKKIKKKEKKYCLEEKRIENYSQESKLCAKVFHFRKYFAKILVEYFNILTFNISIRAM